MAWVPSRPSPVAASAPPPAIRPDVFPPSRGALVLARCTALCGVAPVSLSVRAGVVGFVARGSARVGDGAGETRMGVTNIGVACVGMGARCSGTIAPAVVTTTTAPAVITARRAFTATVRRCLCSRATCRPIRRIMP
jgi:hypothetical protein